MKNKPVDIFHYANTDNIVDSVVYANKQLFSGEKISDDELENFVENKLEYLQYLISVSPKKLELKPLKDGDTFACGLGEEIDQYMAGYLTGKFGINKIPSALFEPKYLYYSLSMMLNIDDQLLREVQGHEMQHALSSDFKDVVRCQRIAYHKQLPSAPIHRFFNVVEDFYINTVRASTNTVRKNGIKLLYKNISAKFCKGILSAKHLPRIQQFELAVIYHYLNQYFPNDYDVVVDITDEIKNHLELVKPQLAKIADITMDNSQRVPIKNITFRPVLEELLRKDMDDQAKFIKYTQELKKLINSKSPKSTKGKNSKNSRQNTGSKPGLASASDDILSTLDDNFDGKDVSLLDKKGLQSKLDEQRKQMTPEEKQKYLDHAKKKIDREGIDHIKKSIPQFDWNIDENGNILPSRKHSSKAETNTESGNEDLQKKIEDMIKQFHKDKKSVDDIAGNIKDLDYQDWKKIEQEEEKIGSIKTKSNKKSAQNIINARKKMLLEKRKRFLEDIKEQGFDEAQEEDYQRYNKLEQSIEPLVDEFIIDLMNDIPKIQDITIQGDYFSGKIYDILDSGRKIRMGHYDVYGREEDEESTQVKLGMSLSIDVSGSMSDVAIEVLGFAIFMSLFCEKLGIPFYINTFGSKVTSIKSFDDQYYSNKGQISRMLTNLQNRTDIGAGLEDLLEQSDKFFIQNRDTLLMPVIITDGQPNQGKDGEELKDIADKFDGNDILVGLGLNDFEKEYFSKIFNSEWKLFLDNAGEIMTTGKERLREYFISMQSKIFK